MKQQSGMAMVAVATLAAVLILVFGYMLGVSPQLTAAGIANDEHALAIQDNLSIEAQTAALKALELEAPGWEADLAAISEQIPSLPDTEHLHRMLIDSAMDAGIPWVEFRIDDTFLIDPAVAIPATDPDAPADDGATTEDEGDGDADTADPSPSPTEAETPVAPPAAASAEGLVAIFFTAKTEGHPAAVKQFLTNFYLQTDRYVTLYGFVAEATDPADPAPGRAALVGGDILIEVRGVAFVLIDPANPLEIDEIGGVPFPTTVSSPSSPAASPSPSPSPSATASK